jgi:hypothetical protein
MKLLKLRNKSVIFQTIKKEIKNQWNYMKIDVIIYKKNMDLAWRLINLEL